MNLQRNRLIWYHVFVVMQQKCVLYCCTVYVQSVRDDEDWTLRVGKYSIYRRKTKIACNKM